MKTVVTRRHWIHATILLGTGAFSRKPRVHAGGANAAPMALNVGSQLELVDLEWIGVMEGLRLNQHRPVPREIVMSSPQQRQANKPHSAAG